MWGLVSDPSRPSAAGVCGAGALARGIPDLTHPPATGRGQDALETAGGTPALRHASSLQELQMHRVR
jgi:hypothetical protein